MASLEGAFGHLEEIAVVRILMLHRVFDDLVLGLRLLAALATVELTNRR